MAKSFLFRLIVSFLAGVGLVSCDLPPPVTENCEPTPFDEIGPFYRSGAPVRDAVGKGYLLKGRVLSTSGCRPLPGSRIEFWLVNPIGEYDDAHRATVFADANGQYRFESGRPVEYVNRKPHIHLLVKAAGHEELITQHYISAGMAQVEFDLVLAPLP